MAADSLAFWVSTFIVVIAILLLAIEFNVYKEIDHVERANDVDSLDLDSRRGADLHRPAGRHQFLEKR